jgi:hypothetical protein
VPEVSGVILRTGLVRALLGLTLAGSLLAGPAVAERAPTPGASGMGDPYFPQDGIGGIDVLHYDVRDTKACLDVAAGHQPPRGLRCPQVGDHPYPQSRTIGWREVPARVDRRIAGRLKFSLEGRERLGITLEVDRHGGSPGARRSPAHVAEPE